MTIHLPEELEGSVRTLVKGGRYTSVDEAMAEAARLLLKQSSASPQPMTERQLHQHMLEIGLMSQLPDIEADYDDPDDVPITITGEPLSETIIRERR